MRVPNATDAAAWYAKLLGASIVNRAGVLIAEIPGLNIRFVETKQRIVGTEGRALERLCFDVTNLETFMTRLRNGYVIVAPFKAVHPQFTPFKAFVRVRDPYGTVIEFDEGFRAVVR